MFQVFVHKAPGDKGFYIFGDITEADINNQMGPDDALAI